MKNEFLSHLLSTLAILLLETRSLEILKFYSQIQKQFSGSTVLYLPHVQYDIRKTNIKTWK